MDQSACKLTLVYPPEAEDHIVELLLNSAPPLPGFTTWQADGHGYEFGKASVRERVRGRVARAVLVLILPRSRAGQLLDEIRIGAAVPGLAFWIEPVETFGRLAHVEAADVEVAQAVA
jgi:hypothetical protein